MGNVFRFQGMYRTANLDETQREEESDIEEGAEFEDNQEGPDQPPTEEPVLLMPHEWTTQRLVAQPPKVHQTKAVKCNVNLLRDTMRLMPTSEAASTSSSSPEDPTTKYQLQFYFDANVECRVRVFFVAQEKRDEDNHLQGYVLSKIDVWLWSFEVG